MVAEQSVPARDDGRQNSVSRTKTPESKFQTFIQSLMVPGANATGPQGLWDALPESLKKSAARKKPETDEADAKGLSMAGQFTKVSTTNPLVHEFLDKRVVRLTGPIDEATAATVIAMMQLLDDMAPGQDIELRINSPGGSITAGLAIYDAMKNLHSDVRTVCEGECMSMAAFLLACGTPGKRVAMPNSTIMVHGPSGGFKGNSNDMTVYMKEMERLKQKMIDLFSQHSGLSVQKLSQMMERDTFLTADDAKALGLIDDVVQPRHKPPFPRISKPAPATPALG